MGIDLGSMIREDLAAGPGADIGQTVVFQASKKRNRAAFTLTGVPVSGIPSEQAGKIDADFDTWQAQMVVDASLCAYKPDNGQRVTVGSTEMRVRNVTADATRAIYTIDLEPIARG